MSAILVGTRIFQTFPFGRVRSGVVDSTIESDLTGRVDIGILFDGDDIEDDAAIEWFQPHELAAAGIEQEPAFRFPTSAADLAGAGLCEHCLAIAEGIRP